MVGSRALIWASMDKTDIRSGLLYVPMAISLVLIALAGFGTWGFLRNWKEIVQLQLRLDRCTGRTSLQLKQKLQTLSSLNQEIEIARASILAASANPPAAQALRSVLEVLVRSQDLIRAEWKSKQALWLLRRGCDRASDLPSPLPRLPVMRDPPDAIGSRPLRWIGPEPHHLAILIRHYPRYSASRIEERGSHEKWHAKWTTQSGSGLR